MIIEFSAHGVQIYKMNILQLFPHSGKDAEKRQDLVTSTYKIGSTCIFIRCYRLKITISHLSPRRSSRPPTNEYFGIQSFPIGSIPVFSIMRTIALFLAIGLCMTPLGTHTPSYCPNSKLPFSVSKIMLPSITKKSSSS